MCDCKSVVKSAGGGVGAHYVINPSSASQTAVKVPMAPKMTRSAELLELILPNTLYKVNSGNNVLDWTHAGTFSFTVPSAAYTASSLCATIQTGMNAADANTYVVTFNADTMKVTVAGAAGFVLNFGTGPNVAVSIGPLLGFAVADTVSGTSVTAGNVIQLFAPLSVYLRIAELGNHVFTSAGQGFAFRVPLTVESGAIMEVDSESHYVQKIDTLDSGVGKTLATMTCTLCFLDGTVCNLNGAGYEFVLEII